MWVNEGAAEPPDRDANENGRGDIERRRAEPELRRTQASRELQSGDAAGEASAEDHQHPGERPQDAEPDAAAARHAA